ncbi:MAG TPA: bifunctional [glutamate--ammonia ligase]-adenylyl-L-tyrosine phosphorylase/[glutamate--ammonia-ligase] adenylyltransferase, partial [Burkholderiaceae bacterium]|nr:bifunctional [glutamate--ammonia ligase]-adenylyl-L-tyrosine phosphorylase/[glutamate--ammonia-ligase] adenylyltransferase [Burkholderiaceae bacterium]
MNPAGTLNATVATADYSRYVQRVRRRFGNEIAALAPGVPDAVAIDQLVDHLLQLGQSLAAALRIARHAVVERLVVLDVEQAAPLEAVTSAMTALAEVALERALARAMLDEEAAHGPPLDAAGQRIDFWIVGMGKLGARELNVSSDIDLVYLYGDEGHTASGSSAHETFARVAKRLHALIGEVTDEGFVFRIDLALRPNGNSGPPVASLAALEAYFQVQGREWERFAWLKSRVIAPRAVVADGRARALGALVTPFVYRRYLDYGVFEGLRQLHRRIREEAQRRAAGRPERANDVKLSRGGIREIEFIVQLMLVVRGGQFPEIRTRSTLRGLDRLVSRGLMKAETAHKLAAAYTLLRRIEHRIQYLDDQQTHVLPTVDADLNWIARSLGNTSWGGARQLLDALGSAREFVANEFDALLHDGQAPAASGRPCKSCGAAPVPIDALAQTATLPPELAARIATWSVQPRVQSLRDETKLRLGRLVMRAAAGVADGSCTEEATLRFVDWLEPLLRRESYVALLDERPEVLRRLLRLLGLARWPMQYLMRHPGVIDELADPRLMHERFDRGELIADLDERHAGWQRSGQADESALLDTLRHAHHAEVFRTLVRDVEGELTVEQVADDLSALADALIDCTLRWAWGRLKNRHRETPRLAVIAYGKLGGKELGYGSDLDVVFLYDDSDEDDPDRAQEVYGAFVRKLITWLTLRTAAGQLFDIDTALRPNGNSGLLSTSIASFERYQQGRGSNTA